MSTKVFVSHASEDKDRFVLGFATKLRGQGIDAWIDKWEMLPGDKLVNKIFEEGIKNAQAVIVVLSNYSVNKPWVKEELDTSVVKRINEGIKLIPVVIDDCQIPECLKSTLYQRIQDLNNYDDELERIVMSIYGHKEKPPLGKPPAYTQTIIDNLPGLTNIDTLVFKLICEYLIEKNPQLNVIPSDHILQKIKPLNIPQEEFYDSLEILETKGYIKAITKIENHIILFLSVTVSGFEEYARVFIENYNSIFTSVILQIVNHKRRENRGIIEDLKQPAPIVNHILNMLEYKDLISVAKVESAQLIHINHVSPELKRLLNS